MEVLWPVTDTMDVVFTEETSFAAIQQIVPKLVLTTLARSLGKKSIDMWRYEVLTQVSEEQRFNRTQSVFVPMLLDELANLLENPTVVHNILYPEFK